MARRRLIRFPTILIFALAVTSVATAAPSRTAVLSDLRIDEQVDGDVVVFGADLELGPGARVGGDAIAIGGDVHVAEGAEVARHVVSVFGGANVAGSTKIGGRVLAFSSLASFLPNSPAHSPGLHASFSMRLLTAGGWLLVTTGLAFLFPTRMRYGAWALPVLGIKVAALGIMVGLTVVATMIAALGLGPALGVPLVATLMIVFFVAKSVGLTVLGCWAGMVVLRRWYRHPLPISLEVFVGVLVLIALRFLPFFGETLWNLISLVALGASIAVIGVSTDLLRAEPSSANQ